MGQTFGPSSIADILLTCVSVVAYGLILLNQVAVPAFQFWFLLVVPTGFSETLPVQQHYLERLLRINGKSSESQEVMRTYVKKSHTGTGVGSAVAFFTCALVYSKFQVFGVGMLGEAVALCKVLLSVVIIASVPPLEPRSDSSREVVPVVPIEPGGPS